MKKVMMSLLVACVFFGFVGCTNKPNEDTEVSKEPSKQEKVVYKELTDPRGKTLESTATGENIPRIVETLYETSDVVVADIVPTEMGYAVDPTGATDSTAGIQAALYDCYENGGGTVYLPAGNYAISDTIHIPPYTSLRGDWQDPEVGTEYGTIISVWMDGEDYEGPGAFKVSGCAGAIGLTIYYPLQTLDSIIPYPFAFFVEDIGSEKNLITLSELTFINAYRGIGTSATNSHQELHLDNIRGSFLKNGICIANSSDVGTVNSIIVNNKYWIEAAADCMNAEPKARYEAYTKKYLTGLRIGDVEWTTFNNIHIDNCAVGVQTVKGNRIDFAGTMFELKVTNCVEGVVLNGLDERWGACIAKSYIEGGIKNNTKGKLKLCGVEVKGELVEKEEKSIVIDDKSDISQYEIDYTTSYTKPINKLYYAELPSGLETDASAELQKVLNEAGKTGGIVYVPGGKYCFRSPISVPAGVELRGASSVPTREAGVICNGRASIGTLFFCYYGDDASYVPEDTAFITLEGENAGLNGIRIMYPENSTRNTEKQEDYITTYTVRGKASGVYAVNCMIAAASHGIDFAGCDNHYIEGFVSTCYLIGMRVGGTGGTVHRCLQNATIMQTTAQEGLVNWIGGGHLFEWVFDYVTRNSFEYVVVENAKDQVIYNTFAYGIKTLINNINSENTYAINIGTDNMGTDCPQLIQNGGSMTAINILRYNGYSYDLESGKLNVYNRLAINEVGERTNEKSK